MGSVLTRHRARHARQQATAGPFRIVITAVRADKTTVADTETPAWYRGEFARDEEQRPEPVAMAPIPLPTDADQAYAWMRAGQVLAAIPAGARPHYRVKVVPA